MRNTVLAVILVACAAPLYAQSGPDAPPPARSLDLSGPRFGLTMLSDGVVKALADRNITVASTISQFGWQFEKQFYTKTSGVTALNEWVVLVGGLDGRRRTTAPVVVRALEEHRRRLRKRGVERPCAPVIDGRRRGRGRIGGIGRALLDRREAHACHRMMRDQVDRMGERRPCLVESIAPEMQRADRVPRVGAALARIDMACRLGRQLPLEGVKRLALVPARQMDQAAQPM